MNKEKTTAYNRNTLTDPSVSIVSAVDFDPSRIVVYPVKPLVPFLDALAKTLADDFISNNSSNN